jgi:hypothetical protein
MRRVIVLILCSGLLASGCDDRGTPDTVDAGASLPAWDKGLPEASVMGVRRGLQPARGIVHLHSPYSHDACDGDPRDDTGAIREDCLASLRRGLCTTAMDFAALTDHDDSMADVEWGPALFLARGADELVYGDGGAPIASRLRCDDGHTLLVFVGGESDLMPLMLDDHPAAASIPARHEVYNGNTAAAIEAYEAAGGVGWIAHTESKDLGLLAGLGLRGLEIYNLHANIDPDIRAEWLGLPANDAIMRVVQFADMTDAAPEPDLAILAFLRESTPAIEKWQALLGQGLRVAGSAGTDAHENALPLELKDGERGDSYRRMMRWFANVALVADPDDPAAIEAALAGGQFFVAFEVFGTPVGFDCVAELAGGDTVEMGGATTVAAGATIVARAPRVHALDPTLPAPTVRTRILRVDETGAAVELASGGDAELRVPVDAPGAYRVEVRITPAHLGPYLGRLRAEGYADVEHVWVYGNPIYVSE